MSTEMVALTDFSYESTGVRILGTKLDPWFVAADVFKALEIRGKYLARTLERLDDDEKMVIDLTDVIDSSPLHLRGEAEIVQGSHNTVWIISEPGLYKIMLRSRTPKAEAFTRFVTHEVLPSIRKNGFYISEKLKPKFDYYEKEIAKTKALLEIERANAAGRKRLKRPDSTTKPMIYVREPMLAELEGKYESLVRQRERLLSCK